MLLEAASREKALDAIRMTRAVQGGTAGAWKGGEKAIKGTVNDFAKEAGLE